MLTKCEEMLRLFLWLLDTEHFNVLVFEKALSALILLSQAALPVYGGTSITLPLKIGMPLSLLRYVNFPFSYPDLIPVQKLVRTSLVIWRISFDFGLWWWGQLSVSAGRNRWDETKSFPTLDTDVGRRCCWFRDRCEGPTATDGCWIWILASSEWAIKRRCWPDGHTESASASNFSEFWKFLLHEAAR